MMFKLQMVYEIVEELSTRIANQGPTYRNYVRIDTVENLDDYMTMQEKLSNEAELREKYVSFIFLLNFIFSIKFNKFIV